jgi:hypothetical protein
MKKLIFVVVGLLALSCTTGEQMRTVNVGDSQDGVVSKLGRPDGQQLHGDTTICFYVNRLMSGWSWDRANYYAKFLNGQLIEYGTGNVRQGMQRIWIIGPK